MKHFILAALLLLLSNGLIAERTPSDKTVATTIDFLDYAFYDRSDGNQEYYPLEAYEQRIREMAEGGIDKIYLRVNVCGLTLYPTRVAAIYGEGGRFHWSTPENSRRLINTLARYNPLTETIRLGHKYGMEVWAWESLFDDSASPAEAPEQYREFGENCRNWFLLDPWYLENPTGFAMKDPRLAPLPEEAAKINEKARRYPITRISFTNDRKKNRPVRVVPEDVSIYTSSDNRNFQLYDKPFTFTTGVTPDGYNTFTIDGLSISDPYVKLIHREYDDKNFTIALRRPRGQGKVFNSRGEEVPSVWTPIVRSGDPRGNPLNFDHFESAAWDYRKYQIGFVVGEVETASVFYGVTEFNVPAAMEHKVARFEELVHYPFDGFMMNLRSHSYVPDPENYGFNPEVREKFLARFGKDIYKDDFNRADLMQLRAEAIAEFFKRCKALTGGRPFFISGLSPRPAAKDDPPAFSVNLFSSLPWLYREYFRDGSVDGVIMLRREFTDYFTPEITGGKPITLGIMREMGVFIPKNYDLEADLKMLRDDPRLSEIELYETLTLTNGDPKWFNAIKKVFPPDPEKGGK